MTRHLTLWLSWVLASAAAGAYFGATTEDTALFGHLVMPGLIVGVAQWLVLRRYLPYAGWWILASALGWILGSIVMLTIYGIIDQILGIRLPSRILSPVVISTLYGAALGAAQWLVLRGHTQRAGWWVLISVVGGAVGWAVGVACPGIPFGSAALSFAPRWAVNGAVTNGVAWAVNGAVTGIALVWLLPR